MWIVGREAWLLALFRFSPRNSMDHFYRRLASEPDLVFQEMMAGLGLLMAQAVVVTSPFFSKGEIQKYLKIRRGYHDQFTAACLTLADRIDEGEFGEGPKVAGIPLRNLSQLSSRQDQQALKMAARALRGLKKLRGPEIPPLMVRLTRMADSLDPNYVPGPYDRVDSEYETFLSGLLRVGEIPAPIRTMFRKLLKMSGKMRPDERANAGAWFDMPEDRKSKLRGLLVQTEAQIEELFSDTSPWKSDPEGRSAENTKLQNKLRRIQNAAGVNREMIRSENKEEPLESVLKRESRIQMDGVTSFIMEKVRESFTNMVSYGKKNIPREEAKVLTQLGKARSFDTVRRIVQEATDRKLIGRGFLSDTLEPLLVMGSKNKAVRDGTKMTPMTWEATTPEEFQAKHSTGEVTFMAGSVPESKQAAILGKVSRALSDLEGIFGKGFCGAHGKPLEFQFEGEGGFAAASYFGWDKPSVWQPRVKFGGTGEGLMAHELSHYFDDLLSNKIGKLELEETLAKPPEERSEAETRWVEHNKKHPSMGPMTGSRDLWGSTGVKLDYMVSSGYLDRYARKGFEELKELAETIVSTPDYSRWSDKTGSAYDMALPVAVKELTGMSLYDLPKDHPYYRVEDIAYKSKLPVELKERTEDVYKRMMNGDDRKLTYHNSGVEIWARMMEQYVYTKLSAQGIANPYLTQMTYDIDVLDQFMDEKTFEEKVVPIMDRLFAKLKGKKLIASLYDRRARSVRLDKNRVYSLSQEIEQVLVQKLRGELPLGKGVLVAGAPYDITAVNGESITVRIRVESVPSESPYYISGGAQGSTKSGVPVVVVYVNGSLPADQIARAAKSHTLAKNQILPVLLHELTHAADRFSKGTANSMSREEARTREDYYNNPGEVRAYTQEIVHEAEESFQYYDRLSERFGPGRALQMTLTGFCSTWNEVSPHWTPENQKRVMKTVAQALQEWQGRGSNL